jgi:hypothetical protein
VPRDGEGEDVGVEKEDGSEGLILRRCADVVVGGQVREERLDIGRAQVAGMFLRTLSGAASAAPRACWGSSGTRGSLG